MNVADRFNRIQQTAQSFGPHYQDAMQGFLQEAGYQRGDWFVSFLAFGLDPAPLTAVFFNSMYPYGNITNHEATLAGTAERGYLAQESDGYRLTDNGRLYIEKFYEVTGAALTAVSLPTPNQTDKIAALLARIVAATTIAAEPVEKPQFLLSRRSDPGTNNSALLRIDQYLTDLIRFRDDAHIAAWEKEGVDGKTWETFTTVWRGQAKTAVTLAERFAGRGHDEAAYTTALEHLTALGWIEEGEDGYTITPVGDKLRQEVEALTNTYFFTGWSALSDDEAVELDTMLAELDEQLTMITAETAAESRRDLWPLLNAIPQSLFPLTREATQEALKEANLNEPGHFFTLLTTRVFDPEPISGNAMHPRFPYANPDRGNGRFEALTTQGYLKNADDGWVLTENGRQILNKANTAFFDQLTAVGKELNGLSVDVRKMVGYLERVTDACRRSNLPNGEWALNHSYSVVAADLELGTMGKLDNRLDDLNAFRDDAHLSAFAQYDISGHGWELFTFLWRGDVANPAEMVEKASFRGYDEATYMAALEDLIARGWVEAGEDGAFVVTAVGDALRQEADVQTDRYFYLPWLALNDEETADLRTVATDLSDLLKRMAEAKATA